jgi:hypothetical protein
VTGEIQRRVASPDFDAPRAMLEPGAPGAPLRDFDAVAPIDDVTALAAIEEAWTSEAPTLTDAQPPVDGLMTEGLAAGSSAPPPPAPRPMRPVAGPMRMAAGSVAALAPMPHAQPRPMRPPADTDQSQPERTATAPQLRRFIKSRAYVPMHELRRRFGIIGDDDDVTPVDLDRTRVFVGLPDREGRLLAELLRGGDIGYELSLDPISPIVVGVYPMRPVTRG